MPYVRTSQKAFPNTAACDRFTAMTSSSNTTDPVFLQAPQLLPETPPDTVFRPTVPVNTLMEGECIARLNEVPDQSVHLVL